jgi:S1-C subfamily serine protease/Tfp pilus assembly protein PilF
VSKLQQALRLRALTLAIISRAAIVIVVPVGVLSAVVSHAFDVEASAIEATANESAAPAPDGSPEELYERVAPSVVSIIIIDQDGTPIGNGSGFFVDESVFIERCDRPENDERYAKHLRQETDARGAYVLTNYHVIKPAVSAEIEFSGGDLGTVWHVIAEDEKLDVALLSVTVPSSHSPNPIPLAATDPPVISSVYAIGSPLGLQGSASEGKVSSYRAIYGNDRWLQTTVPISPGSSGGPLLSADGKLVGITTLSYSEGQNLNFAIPVSTVRTFLSTAPFKRRDIAEGASLRWHEEKAFEQAQAALWSGKHSAAEKHALTQLLNARVEVDRALAEPPTADVNQAIAWVQAIEDSLPKELEYLRHYLIGKASVSAARGLAHFAESAKQNVPVPLSGANAANWTDEARIRYRTSHYATDAAHHLREAIKLRPDFSPAHRSLYDHHRASGSTPDALLTSDALVRLMPRSAEALALRAECYSDLNQPESAKNGLEAALEFSPHDGKLHYKLANVRCDLGDYDDAIKTYQSALACNPQNLRDTIHYHLGLAYHKSGNPEKALAEFRTAKAFGWPPNQCDAQIAACKPRQSIAAAPLAIRTQAPELRQASLGHHQITVYITKTGKKYHRDGCQHLRRSKVPIALSQAANLYEPCAHCHPPILDAIGSKTANVAVSQHADPRD